MNLAESFLTFVVVAFILYLLVKIAHEENK